jgi:hypothetical protein
VDRSKLVVGIQFHANTFNLTDEHQNGILARANGIGEKGPKSNHPGRLGFDEVKEKQS